MREQFICGLTDHLTDLSFLTKKFSWRRHRLRGKFGERGPPGRRHGALLRDGERSYVRGDGRFQRGQDPGSRGDK
jgi:hypothetical protein